MQANSTAHALEYAFDIPKAVTGIVMALLALLVMPRDEGRGEDRPMGGTFMALLSG
ncbi:hypothetical protein ACNKHO_00035 [Shigella flexneri]